MHYKQLALPSLQSNIYKRELDYWLDQKGALKRPVFLIVEDTVFHHPLITSAIFMAIKSFMTTLKSKEYMDSYLRNTQHIEIITFTDGLSAVDYISNKANADKVALISMDVSMPIMTGDVATRHIAALEPTIPVLFGSSDVDQFKAGGTLADFGRNYHYVTHQIGKPNLKDFKTFFENIGLDKALSSLSPPLAEL